MRLVPRGRLARPSGFADPALIHPSAMPSSNLSLPGSGPSSALLSHADIHVDTIAEPSVHFQRTPRSQPWSGFRPPRTPNPECALVPTPC